MILSKSCLIAAIIIHTMACFCFYFGFAPLSITITKKRGTNQNLVNVPLKYTHLVVIIIDSFRTDFLLHNSKWSSKMPFLQEQIAMRKTYSFQARTKPPTVTMPRLKAFTSGVIPGFNDLMLNTASISFTEDNIVSNFHNNGYQVVFYGDDTWLKLFPSHFIRYEGTHSFFVHDFTEVDNNVTRNVLLELRRTDWDVMLLHYLGLDHIGHAEGPNSRHIPGKLYEMDTVIRKIFENMVERDTKLNSSTLLLICGDHGMSDAGSHGGASKQEIYTPAVFMDTKLEGKAFMNETIEQVDLAATISVLFGLSIPSSSVGRFIPEFYSMYHTNEQLRIQQVTACQLSLLDPLLTELESICKGEIQFSAAEKILKEACATLQSASAEQNVRLMISSIILMIVSTIAIYNIQGRFLFHGRVALSPTVHTCFKSVGNMNVSFEKVSILATLFTVASTSFIEEEHYGWYYFISTYLLFLFIQSNVKKNIYSFVMLALFVRLARTWNSTGVKWLFTESIVKWFHRTERQMELYTLTFVLCFLVFLIYTKKEKKIAGRIFLTSAFVLFVVYRVSMTYGTNSLYAVTTARVIYIQLLFGFLLLKLSVVENTRTLCLMLCMLLLRSDNLVWFCFVVFIDVFVWEKAFNGLFDHLCVTSWRICWFVFMLCKFTYFSQGNSNSLSTIDISAGMIGFHVYHPIIANILTYLATYCTQIFWIASFVDHVKQKRLPTGQYLQMVSMVTIYQAVHNIMLSCIVYTNRYHLFIWSVFAPKYLYTLANLLFIVSLDLFTLIWM